MAFALGRAALFAFVHATLKLLPMRSPNPYPVIDAFDGSAFWNAFVRWDSGWYATIVENGYVLTEGQSNVAFFPLFPYLSRWLGPLFDNSFAAGLVLSNLGLFGGLAALHRLVTLEIDEDTADRAVLFVLVFPSTIFFSAFYTEGIFFFFVACSLLCFRTEQLLLAGLLGLGAALTRSTGALLAPAYFVALVVERGLPRSLRDLGAYATVALIPLGTAIFAWHLERTVGDPLAFVRIQETWGRGARVFPLLAIYRDAMQEQQDFYRYVEVLGAVVSCAACVAAVRRLPIEQTVFLWLSTLLPLTTGTTDSMMRFAATMLPIYPLLAIVTRRPSAERALTVLCVGLASLTTARFVLWHWAG